MNKSIELPFKDAAIKFKKSNFNYTLSAREISSDQNIITYLKFLYMFINKENMESVFGFVSEKSSLYGGRLYQKKYALTEQHIKELYDNNIALSLPLTNHFFDLKSYRSSVNLLKKHHRKGNSIVCVNDELAKAIKNDFPDYILKASIIKNLNSVSKIEEALSLYDYAVLPMDKNNDINLLSQIKQKERVILFANAACAYNCPARTCYLEISKRNRGEKFLEDACSKSKIFREDKGIVFFDIEKLGELGFSSFKLIPRIPKTPPISNIMLNYSVIKGNIKRSFFLSFPKCGRTWMRFAIGNYLNTLHNLNVNLDLRNVFNILPNNTTESISNFKSEYKLPLILFDHSIPEKINIRPEEKIIFLIRAPKDTLVSYFYHLTYQNKIFKGDIHEFIKSEYGIKALVNYYNKWSKVLSSRAKKLVISYEEIHNNTSDSLKAILSHLDIEINDKFIKKTVEISSFKNMKKAEKKIGANGYKVTSENDSRMRVGKVNNYHVYLNEEEISYIDNYSATKLSDDAKKILKNVINQS